MVLCDAEGQPNVGLELKKVCSSYRATKVFLAVEPDTKHLVQAAHYSWQLGKLPWILSYTSDSSYDTPYWAFKKYNVDKSARKIAPGRQHFYCGWVDDTFVFIHPETRNVVPTDITSEGIRRFYEMIPEMERLEDLGPRPSNKPAYEGDSPFKNCEYCAFADACDRYDDTKDFAEWKDAITVVAQNGEPNESD